MLIMLISLKLHIDINKEKGLQNECTVRETFTS
jgi:hypothetical protein